MDIILSVILLSQSEIALHIAKQAKSKRLVLNLSQQTLAQRSGVSYGSLKKFEQTGMISLQSLIKLALVLDCLDDVMALFQPKKDLSHATIDDILKENSRKRGRK
jgi:transcriptional regulator with XRE-family HTH domain